MRLRSIGFYPGEVSLFEGGFEITKDLDPDMRGSHFVDVPESGLLVNVHRRVVDPLRTEYTGFALNQVLDGVTCHVDLELEPQPRLRTVVQAILAEMHQAVDARPHDQPA